MTPKQKPHRSEQDVETPAELMEAIVRAFSVREWSCDLAATASNSKATMHLGPGSLISEDALKSPWPMGDCWLNPPYSDIEPWAKRCAEERSNDRAGRIFILTPASTGADWFTRWVLNRAHVVAISPRVTFVGHKQGYPKDLVISVFGPVVGGVSTWRWKP